MISVAAEQILVAEQLTNGRHRGAVARGVGNGGLRLVPLSELRPHIDNGLVERQVPVIDELQCEQREQRFAGG